MHALVDRLTGRGLPTRLFGHPAAPLTDRDALVASAGALVASVFAWFVPDFALPLAAGAVLLCAAIGFRWLAPWPRSAAWTVIIGRPGPGIRRVAVLALDVRKPRSWLTPAAGGAAVMAGLAPDWVGAMAIAAGVFAAALFDRVRGRNIPIEQAEAWVVARGGDTERLILVSTAGSGHGEGIQAVVDWFGLAGGELVIEIDEEVTGATARHLRNLGIGRTEPVGGSDVAVGDRARG